MLDMFNSDISKVGFVTVDKANKQFKLRDINIPGKKGGGLLKNSFKATLAVTTWGMSLLVPGGGISGGKKKTGWIPFEDLVSYELLQNDDVVVSGGVGQAIIGGVVGTALLGPLFGAAGMIAGGNTAKRTTSTKINSLAVRITLNSFDMPCCFVYLIEKPTKNNSKTYREAVENAQQLLSTLDLIVHNKN